MAKIVGLTKDQVKRQATSDLIQSINEQMKTFESQIDFLLNKDKKGFFEQALGVVGEVGYSLTKGLIGTLGDMVGFAGQAVGKLSNSLNRAFQSDDFLSGLEEIGKGVVDIGIDAVEGISNFAVSTVANAGGLVGVDKEWAFGNRGLIDYMGKNFQGFRNDIYDIDNKGGMGLPNQFGKENDFVSNLENQKTNKEIENQIYLKETQDWLRGTVSVQNWFDRNITENVANVVGDTLAMFTPSNREYVRDANAENKFYQAIVGTSESIGRILGSWGIGRIGSKIGLSQQQVKTLTSTYFASTIFADNFQQAINNGATIQNAYTYATGSALMETIIENLGGFTAGGVSEKMGILDKLTNKLLGAKWGSIVSNAFEEGIEEVISAFGDTASEKYSNPENKYDYMNNKDFISSVFFSFLGGALSSLALGIGRNIYIDTTLEGKYQQVSESFDQEFDGRNPEKVTKRFEKRLGELVDVLNKPKTKGFKDGGNGEFYFDNLTVEEKQKYIKETGLSNVITFKDGKFEMNFDAQNIRNLFKNTNNGEAINNQDYAINDNVRQKDISNNGKYEVLKRNEVNAELINQANKYNVDIAFVSGVDSQAFVDTNNIIYVNIDQVNASNFNDVLIRHEVSHILQNQNKTVANEMYKMANDIIMSDTVDSKIKTEIQNALYEIDYRVLSNEGFTEEQIKKMTPEEIQNVYNQEKYKKAVELKKQEVVAYLIEKFSDKQFLRIVSSDKISMFEKLNTLLNDNKQIKELSSDKKVGKELVKLKKVLNTALKTMVKKQSTLRYITSDIFGKRSIMEKMIKSKFIDRFGVEEIINAVQNMEGSNIILGGKSYYIFDVFNTDETILAKVNLNVIDVPEEFDSVSKRITVPNLNIIRSNIELVEENKNSYLRILSQKASELFELGNESNRSVVNIIEKIKKDGLNSLSVFEKSQVSDIIAEFQYNKEMKEYNKKISTDDDDLKTQATFNAVARVVKYMNNTESFNKFENRTFAKNLESGAYMEYQLNNYEYKDIESDVIIDSIIPSMLELNPILKDNYYVDGILKDNTLQILIIPKEELIENEAKVLLKKRLDLVEETLLTDDNIKRLQTKSFVDLLDGRKIVELNSEYDINNIVSLPVETENALVPQLLELGFDSAPVVSAVLPANWNSSFYAHVTLPNNYKLIRSEVIGKYKGDSVSHKKMVTQIWVKNDNPNFFTYKDLRNRERVSKIDDFQVKTIDNVNTWEKNKDFDFDIALVFEKTADFNNIITDKKDIKKGGKYFLISVANEQVLEDLKKIDFNELAKKGSNIYNGYTVRDLVNEYLKNKPFDPVAKRINTDDVKRLFGNDVSQKVIDAFFNIQKDGSYSLKNKKALTLANNVMTIDGKEYSSNEYAIHAYNNFNSFNLELLSEAVASLTDLNKEQRQAFDILSSTKINFIVYKTKKLSNTMGFSYNYNAKVPVVYINKDYLVKSVNEVFIHETFHEIFRLTPAIAKNFITSLRNILFDENNKATSFFKNFDESYYGGFLSYIKRSYGVRVNSLDDFSKIINDFINNNDNVSTVNELTAQIVGKMFSNQQVFETISTEKDIILQLFRVSEIVKNNQNDPMYQVVSNDLSNILKSVTNVFENLLPNKDKVYTLKELNGFIKTFTNGRITTKKQLVEEYAKEKSKGNSGYASMTVDNIIYLASVMEKTVNTTINNFTALKNEFNGYKNFVNEIITNDKVIDTIDNIALEKNIKWFRNEMNKKSMFDILGLENTLEAMNEDYQNIPDTFIDMFGLVEKNEFDEIIRDYIDGDLYGDFDTKEDFEKLVKNFRTSELNKLFQRILESDIYAKDSLFKNLIGLKNDLKNSIFKNTSEKIDYRLREAVRKLNEYSKQKDSPFSDDIKQMINRIGEISSALKNKEWNTPEKKLEVLRVLRDIRKDVESSKKFKDAFENGKVKSDYQSYFDLYDNMLEDIYKQFASLFNDKYVLSELYTDEQTKERLANTSLNQIVKSYNANLLSKKLADLVIFMETEYKTSLSKNNKTHNQYTVEKMNQFSQFFNERGKPLEKTRFNYFWNPQDFLGYFTDIFGKDSFFGDFFDQYKYSARRSNSIIANFTRMYEDFQKNNKEIKKKSLEKVELDGDYFANIRTDIFSDIKKRVEDTRKPYVEERKKLLKDISELKQRRLERSNKVKDIRKQLEIPEVANHPSQSYILKDNLKRLYAENREDMKKIKENRERIKNIVSDINKYSYEFLLKSEIIKMKNDPKYKKNMNVSKGHVISLYLSVLRENEMHEMYDSGDNSISPTNHFSYGNLVYMFDNEMLVKKGFKYTKDRAIPLLITANDRTDLLQHLESMLTEEDMITIGFAKQQFDVNYNYLNEEFLNKYEVELPRQETYIPYASMDSDYGREMEFQMKNRSNIGVADGMVKQTSLGANVPLRIENIYNVIENHTDRTAKYSFERIITDFQNFVTNKTSGTTFQQLVTGKDNNFGTGNNILETINLYFRNILNYSDITEAGYIKLFRTVLRNSISSTMALNVSSVAKQTASIFTIYFKYMTNKDFGVATLPEFIKNVGKNLGKSKYRRWLMENNDEFFLRAYLGNRPSIAEDVGAGMFNRFAKGYKNFTDALGFPSGWMDNTVLVGAFETIVNQIKRKNKDISDNDAYTQANEVLNDILLYGVASTTGAFRSNFSNDKNLVAQMGSKFQSENIMQNSRMMRIYYSLKNGLKVGRGALRDLLALISSALFTAFISNEFASARGYVSKEDKAFELWVNEFMLGNIIGIIPIVNQFTQLIEFDKDSVIKKGFEPKFPLQSELYNIVNNLNNLITSKENKAQKLIKIFEDLGSLVGFPIRNVKRLVGTTSRLLGETGNKTALEMNRFLNSQTKTQALNKAVKEGKTKVIETYIDNEFQNDTIVNEVARILTNSKDIKISFYNYDSFKKDNVSYDIPSNIKSKYSNLLERSLRGLIMNNQYRRIKDDEQKAKAIQRVINYYWNFMKGAVLKEKQELLPVKDIYMNSLSYVK